MQGDKGHNWYIVQVLSGSEEKVVSAVKLKIAGSDKESLFSDFFIPEEERSIVRRGKKIKERKKIFPGYLLVKMVFSDDAWHIISSVPKVTGFLGDGSKPKVVSDCEINNIYKRIEVNNSNAAQINRFSVGDVVNIIEGPFSSFSATIQKVDVKKEVLFVVVSIFGRQTLLELRFEQVDKS